MLAPSLDPESTSEFVRPWPYPLVRHALEKSIGKSNLGACLCVSARRQAIITAIHE